MPPIALHDVPFALVPSEVRLFLEVTPAGFPSPAQDDMEEPIDLGAWLVETPAASYIMRVDGHSMAGAGINDGDLIVVSRAVKPRAGSIVVALVHGDRTLKRLKKLDGRLSVAGSVRATAASSASNESRWLHAPLLLVSPKAASMAVFMSVRLIGSPASMAAARVVAAMFMARPESSDVGTQYLLADLMSKVAPPPSPHPVRGGEPGEFLKWSSAKRSITALGL